MGRRGGRGGRPTVMAPHANGKKVLEQMATETGGRFFEVSKKHPLEKVYAEIEEDLRHQDSMGYTPQRSDKAYGYRRIHLTTRDKNLIVQTRQGYYAT
jgi:VWFA-related protein